jgi:hypothetical protein
MYRSLLLIAAVILFPIFGLSSSAVGQSNDKRYNFYGAVGPVIPLSPRESLQTGINGSIGLQYRLNSRFEIGDDVEYNRFRLSGTAIPGHPNQVTMSGHIKMALMPEQSRFRPYLLSGAGGSFGFSGLIDGPRELAFMLVPAGLGMDFKAGKVNLFVESRYQVAFTKNQTIHHLPVRLGFRVYLDRWE